MRLTIAQQLEDAGYAVVQVDHGEEALAIIEGADRIDALVTDLRLPGRVDGWDIAEHARRVRPALPVVYVSAFSYVTPRQVPGSIMLDKPAPHDALIGALDDLLG